MKVISRRNKPNKILSLPPPKKKKKKKSVLTKHVIFYITRGLTKMKLKNRDGRKLMGRQISPQETELANYYSDLLEA